MALDARRIPEVIKSESRLDSARRRCYNVWAIIGATGIVVLCALLLKLLSTPAAVLLWTAVFVFCLRGTVSFFVGKGLRRALSVTLAYIIMFVVIGLLGVLLFAPMTGVSSQFKEFAVALPGYFQDISAWLSAQYDRFSYLLDSEQVNEWLTAMFSSLSTWASGFASEGAAEVVNLGKSMLRIVVIICFALVLAFWLLLELPALGRELERLAGEKHREGLRFVNLTVTNVMGGYIRGMLIQCVAVGAASTILFVVLGVPSAIVLGVLTGILTIIPIIGAWAAGILAVVLALFVSPLTAVLTLVGFIVIQELANMFVVPRVMQGAVDVHPVITIIALLAASAVGGALGGITGSLVGMLVSIPAVAVLKAVFVYYFEKRTGRRVVAEDGVFFKGVPPEGDVVDPVADAVSPNPGTTASLPRVGKGEGDPSSSGSLFNRRH